MLNQSWFTDLAIQTYGGLVLQMIWKGFQFQQNNIRNILTLYLTTLILFTTHFIEIIANSLLLTILYPQKLRLIYYIFKIMNGFGLQVCQVCDKEPVFVCGDCHTAKYCTSEHRNQHWRIHKQQCKVIKQQKTKKIEQAANKARMEIRKRYFQHFSHKIYDQCIVIAHQLFELQKKHMEATKEIFNQFQYGISVCILCRTYLTINRKFEAKQEIDNYIREKIHFLQDLRNIPSLKQVPNYPLKAKEFLEKKLTLISAVTNIYHELKQNCIKYYQIYTDHIELVFGQDSLQLSNVYFCVGNYYKQINEVTKSIACFVKAATIRGKKGGDCYVNISLLYRRQNRIYAAIDMMLTAIKLNQEEYGHNSREVGEVYEKLGLLYLDVLDFNNAILNLESALKIFINQKESDDYDRIKKKIQLIYDKIKNSVDQEHLKQKKFLKKKEEEQRIEEIQKKTDLDFKKNSQADKIFKISQNLMNKLNPMQLLRLSQLQLMLEKCTSEYAIAFNVGNSQFLKKLSDNRKKQFRAENQKLFQLITIQVKFREQNEDL